MSHHLRRIPGRPAPVPDVHAREFRRLPGLSTPLGLLFSAILLLIPASRARAQEPGRVDQEPQTQSASEPQTQTAPAQPEPAAPPPPPLPLPTDEEIQSQIEEALAQDAAIAGHGTFKVKCEEGIVTLSGKAESLSVINQAERRAGEVRGVLDLVVLAGITTAGLPDSQILLDIQRALDIPSFHGDRVAVDVAGGQVRLSGSTATYARKLLAERCASEVPGAVSIQNNLWVAAPREGDDAELARRIRLLLTGGLTPVPGEFEVTVKNREAVLRGRVPLYSHRIQAERLAYSVGGIISVQNRLKVDPLLPYSPRIAPPGTP